MDQENETNLNALAEQLNAKIDTKANITDVTEAFEKVREDLGETNGRVKVLEEKPFVLYDDIANEENPERKAITLKNGDCILGTKQDGTTVNLGMVSKWNVADFGSKALHANINTAEIVTINDKDAVITDKNLGQIIAQGENTRIDVEEVEQAGFKFNKYTVNALTNDKLAIADYEADKADHEVEVEAIKADIAIRATQADLDTTDGKIAAVIAQLQALEAKYNEVRLSNVEIISVYDDDNNYYVDGEKDYILSGQVEAPLNLTAKSVTLRDMAVNAAVVTSKTTGDFNMKTVEIDGVYNRKVQGNSVVNIHSDSYVTIRDCIINPENAYNGLEIGLTTGLAKGIIIDNVDFAGSFSNNAINIFGTAENCVVTISNCHFESVSQMLRLSNRTGAHVTVNLINCTIDKCEPTGAYAGLILCQDYTSADAEAVEANNLFAPELVTINMQNVIGPNGKLIAPENMADICGSGTEQQILYVYSGKTGVVAYDQSKYPTLNIQ